MSTDATKHNNDVVRLTEADEKIVLHPQDDDLFVRTGKQVIAACQLTISFEVWLTELQSMFEHVQAWAASRSDAIRSCHCAPRGQKVVFFLCPKSDSFNFVLEDEIVDLSYEISGRFNVGQIEIHQIPWSEADRFITNENARLVYGEPLGSSHSMEA